MINKELGKLHKGFLENAIQYKSSKTRKTLIEFVTSAIDNLDKAILYKQVDLETALVDAKNTYDAALSLMRTVHNGMEELIKSEEQLKKAIK